MNTDTIRNLVVHMRNSVTNLGVMPEYYRDNLNNICTLLEREVGLQPGLFETAKELIARGSSYLEDGGLLNPEVMDPEITRDLVIDFLRFTEAICLS
jgi:hypothetical protein